MAIDQGMARLASYIVIAFSVCFGMINTFSYLYFANIAQKGYSAILLSLIEYFKGYVVGMIII